MALPISGAWRANNANANQYVGARRWGTGSNPIHEVWGEGPPLKTTGRLDGPSNPTDVLSDVPSEFEAAELLGYTPDDIATTLYFGMTPPVGTDTGDLRHGNPEGHPDWSVVPYDPAATQFRDTPGIDPKLWASIPQSFPTESVSEGWLNKTAGQINDAEVSDPVQYERQTSMQQVNPAAGRNNGAAQLRGTDDPRENILTRLTGVKIKPWSTGQRLADMFPYQQDTILRPFWYRTAGTGDPGYMNPNSMVVIDPVQRDVPPDPYLGQYETAVGDQGGYTGEDMTYA